MRLQALYFFGALAVAAIPLSAGAQPLPANDQGTTNAQAANPPVQQCAPGWVWEDGGYSGSGTWRPPHCASLGGTIDF
jgi:hypothetical protein